jgi:16S rRNA (uracil1498-N3)-methyltransferase
MDDNAFFKLPRLYIDTPLAEGADVPLSAEQAHYFRTVLRRQDGDRIRLFNGRDGEFLCMLRDLGKKSGIAFVERLLRQQQIQDTPDIHLYFAPIKKSRMDWLIEKAVELGVTHLHPVITQNTEVREVNDKRLRQQIIEAAEQCERLTVPSLHASIKFDALPRDVPILACLERGERIPIQKALKSGAPVFFLIGPEGGFTLDESAKIHQQSSWTAISLGPRILRCETAVCMALSAVILR